MREKAVKALSGFPDFIPVAAPAEATTLPNSSVSAVTMGSALHWFDPDAFGKECRRILTPGGLFFSVINARDYEDPFTKAQHALCERFCPRFSSLRHGLLKTKPRAEAILGEQFHEAVFDFPLTYQKEDFLLRSLSSSYAPEEGSPECNAYVTELRRLMEEFFPDSDTLTVPNVSVVFWGNPK